MAKLTPQEQAEKWARRLKGSTTDIQRGVERVTVAPGQAAAKQQQKMINNLTESVSSGRWARKVAAVSADEWKRKTITKGVQRIAAGVDDAAPRALEVATNLQSAQAAIDSKLQSMPHMNLQDGINRMVTQVTEMSKNKGKI